MYFIQFMQSIFNLEQEINFEDPALDGSVAKIIFQTAAKNIKDDTNVFFKMVQEASQYSFTNDLVTEIKK